MTHKETLEASRRKTLVPDGKFDCHMTKARLQDIISKRSIFDCQTEEGILRESKRQRIQSSTY